MCPRCPRRTLEWGWDICQSREENLAEGIQALKKREAGNNRLDPFLFLRQQNPRPSLKDNAIPFLRSSSQRASNDSLSAHAIFLSSHHLPVIHKFIAWNKSRNFKIAESFLSFKKAQSWTISWKKICQQCHFGQASSLWQTVSHS